jgi:hypothetical protein
MVEVGESPGAMDAEVGLAEIEKSGAKTVTVNVVLWLRLELPLSVPLTVT